MRTGKWSRGWHASVEVQPSIIWVWVSGDTGRDVLRAALPREPGHYRSLLTMLEGVALWSQHGGIPPAWDKIDAPILPRSPTEVNEDLWDSIDSRASGLTPVLVEPHNQEEPCRFLLDPMGESTARVRRNQWRSLILALRGA